MMLACKRADRTRSHINRSGVHWRIIRRQSRGTSFCGGTNNAKGHKGGKRYYIERIIIHRSAIECTISHKRVDNGKSATKADGDGVVWNRRSSEEKMHNLGQNYTSGERY